MSAHPKRTSLAGAFLSHYNKLFWAVFVLAAVLMVCALFSAIYLDIALGLVLVAVGLHKLDLELNNRYNTRGRKVTENYMNNVGRYLSMNHNNRKETLEKHERMLHTIDKKRATHEKKLEKQYRDLVRKFLETEAKLRKLEKSRSKKV